MPPSERATGVPPDLDELCRKLLDRDPTRRPSGPQILAGLNGRREAPAGRDEQLVGREAHAQALRDAFEATRTGRSITVHVSGRAGMGKSALVRAFLDGLAERAEAVVLRGRAYERETVPYKAVDSVIDALSRHLMHLSDDDRSLALPADMDALARLFPVLRRVPSVGRLREGATADPARLRRRAFEALRALLAALASRQPLVVAIDDVECGDVDSVALLLELVRPPHAPGILLVLVHQDEDKQTAPFLSELRRRWPADAELRSVSVGPLSTREATQLALGLLGSEDALAREMADAVAHESGGSPFLLEEIARGLPRRVPDATGSPITLDDLVGARLTELPDVARDVVQMIAVAGRPLPIATLAEAAGVDAIDGVVASLVAHRFVRPGLRDGREVVEPTHDRIGKTIVALLSAPAIRQHHARLARALERMPDSDPEALAVHLIGAGETERAAQYAEHAAERAVSNLAFDQAVRLQRMALEGSPAAPPNRRRLRARLGQMLEWAGFGAEAAGVYLEAAEGAAPLERAEFERNAAEQLLTCGRIDDGAEVLRRTLASAGLRTPRSPLRAILWLLVYRAWVGFVGLRFKERPGDELPRLERLRLDALFAAALGFAVVDVLLGACIQMQYLAMALRSGERLHVIRAALLVATQYANAGGPERARERALRALARRLVDQTDSAEMRAFFDGTRGVGLFLRGRWPEAREVLDGANAELPTQRGGWHSNANLFAVYALPYLGRLLELAARYERLSREAEQRGDLYTAVNLQLSPARVLSLAADDPEAARRNARQAMGSWSQRGYLLQHWQAMRTEAEADLYVGNAERAYEHTGRDARALGRSFLLKGQLTRVFTAELRGRCAIASVEAVPELRSARLAEARRLARKLDREGMPYAAVFAAVLRAGAAGVSGNEQEAAEWLHVAIRLGEETEMLLHAAAARRALGALLGGDMGGDLVRRADEAMEAQGIRAPARFAAMLVPGYTRRS